MVALVSVETVLLVLLVVLVAGLLRSHAEILRRLGSPGAGDGDLRDPGHAGPIASAPAADTMAVETRAAAIVGATPDGDAVKLDFDGTASTPTLLAFLTTGCGTCATFWDSLAQRGAGSVPRTVIVTHGVDRERPARLRSLAPAGVQVVMSSQAWEDYGVPGAPYFVLVDGAIRGEGVATTWQALASLVGDAIDDHREVRRAGSGAGRARRVDTTLANGGIGPDHPSLYPGELTPNGGERPGTDASRR